MDALDILFPGEAQGIWEEMPEPQPKKRKDREMKLHPIFKLIPGIIVFAGGIATHAVAGNALGLTDNWAQYVSPTTIIQAQAVSQACSPYGLRRLFYKAEVCRSVQTQYGLDGKTTTVDAEEARLRQNDLMANRRMGPGKF